MKATATPTTRKPRVKTPIHYAWLKMWTDGMTHAEIASAVGTSTNMVSQIASKEGWRRILIQMGKRAEAALVKQGAQTLVQVKRRHSRIAAAGLARAERLLAQQPDAPELSDVSRAVGTFAELELVRHPEFVPGVDVRFPELVTLLQSIWDRRLAHRSATHPQPALPAGGQKALSAGELPGERERPEGSIDQILEEATRRYDSRSSM